VFSRDIGPDKVRYESRQSKEAETLGEDGVCAELKKSEDAFRAMTGRGFDGVWRAPGGKTTPNALKFAQSCGYRHVGWTPAGFSGDELSSEKFPSDKLIAQQIRAIRDGDILLWHLGIWSRKDPLYTRLEELIVALKSKGLCFALVTGQSDGRRDAVIPGAKR
jgi:peptidoglycan/xylan/chitin deacetylase (PgdA/CDA1 family)